MRRFAAILALLLPAARAGASPVDVHLSPAGLDWLEAQIPSFVPGHLDLPPLSKPMFSCDNGGATFTQSDTSVDLSIDALDLSFPERGVLRVDVTLTTSATGVADLVGIYGCYGELVCRDALRFDQVRAVLDFTASVDGAGKPHVALRNLELPITADQIGVSISDCDPADLVNTIVGLAKDVGTDLAMRLVEQLAENTVGPLLEDVLAGFTTYQGNLTIADFDARLTSIDLAQTGIDLGADVDFTSRYGAAACIDAADPGEPTAPAGARPDLAAGTPSHLAAAVSLGVVNDALYHVWQDGLLCISPDTLRSFGIDLDLHKVGDLLPGFPAGTTFTLAGNIATPPRVTAAAGDGATLTAHLEGAGIDLIASLPDGGSRTVHVTVDASATATVRIDPTVNALALTIDAVRIDRFDIEDTFDLAAAGFDAAKLGQLIQDHVVPGLLAGLGQIPVTGPVFGGIQDAYAILRDVHTTTGYLVAKVDLFRAPGDDRGVPETTIEEQPRGVVRPADARLVLGGSDDRVPEDLLRYQVSVDGRPLAPTYLRALKVGEAGRTATYHVTAAAIDLAGNQDPTPASADVTVDGVLPSLLVTTQLLGAIDTVSPTVAWTASDDLSAPDQIAARVKVETIANDGSTQPVSEVDVPAGTRSTVLQLAAGRQYRLTVSVLDEAGNSASESLIFAVSADASGASGGCRVGARTTGAPLLVLFALGLLVRRRRAQ